jgi:virginiamycin B lyase
LAGEEEKAMRLIRLTVLGLLVLAACVGVAGAAPIGTVTLFPLPSAHDTLGNLRAGADGNLWFNDTTAKAMWKVTPGGVMSEFALSAAGGGTPGGVSIAGADGNTWFQITSPAGIGKISPSGQITEYRGGAPCPDSVPTCVGSLYVGSTISTNPALGPDGNIWFGDRGGGATPTPAVGMITPSGAITEFSVVAHGGNPHSFPYKPAPGPDGNVWFVDRGEMTGGVAAIMKVTLGGAISEYSSGLVPGSDPYLPVAGPDGTIWFADKVPGGAIGEIDPATGAIQEFRSGLNPGSIPQGMGFGTDGNLWFTDVNASNPAIGMFDPHTHAASEYSIALNPNGGGVVGPDGNFWFVHSGSPPDDQAGSFGLGLCHDSLAGCNLRGANVQNINLDGANLAGDNLLRAELENAHLIGANLQGANLNGAQLQGYTFLAGANLADANLHGADLSGADLSRADLTEANLHGATLRGVTWSHTTCPDGSDSDNDGGTCANNR